MTRKGQISVTGTQWDEAGGEQTTRTTATAEFHTGSGSSYILYEESTDDREIIKTMIKLKGSTLELTKKGAVNARMVFEPGKEHMTLYATPFGSLPLGILTDTVESAISEDGLQISAAYSLTCPAPASQGALPQEQALRNPSPQAPASPEPPPQEQAPRNPSPQAPASPGPPPQEQASPEPPPQRDIISRCRIFIKMQFEN